MKLFGSTENKITQNENDKTVTHLEMTKAVLDHVSFLSNDYQHDWRVLYAFFPNK